MLGNVWEWVADVYQNDYYQTLSSPAIGFCPYRERLAPKAGTDVRIALLPRSR